MERLLVLNFTCYEVVVFMKAVAHLSKNSLQSFRLGKGVKLSSNSEVYEST